MEYANGADWYVRLITHGSVLNTPPPAHESATRTARLRVELSQSHHEQQEYLKNVEVARILAKRERKRAGAPMEHEDWDASCGNAGHEETKIGRGIERKTRQKEEQRTVATSIDDVLSDVF